MFCLTNLLLEKLMSRDEYYSTKPSIRNVGNLHSCNEIFYHDSHIKFLMSLLVNTPLPLDSGNVLSPHLQRALQNQEEQPHIQHAVGSEANEDRVGSLIVG